MVPELKLIDNTLFIDNSRLENFTTCDRRGEYAIVHARVQSGFNAALFAGEVFHLAMQYRYLYWPVKDPIPPIAVWKMCRVVEMAYAANPEVNEMRPDEYRTMEYVRNVVQGYTNQYPREDFEVLSYLGRLLTERSFAVPLGEIDGIKVVWIGRIDLAIRLLGSSGLEVWVLDHKTSKQGGAYFISSFTNSSQMQGYTLVLSQVLKEPVQGVFLNVVVTREITRTGKGVEYQRAKLRFDYETLESWRENILHLAADFLHCYERKFFPMRTTQCVTRWGNCPYMDVCALGPSQREAFLYSGAYKSDEFSPMHKDRVNLEQVHNEALPDGWQRQLELKPATKGGVDVTALINDIITSNKINA